MKRISVFFIILSIFIVPVYAKGAITVEINSAPVIFDTEPTIISGRTMVPVRAIFEALGASVEWNDATRTVTARKNDTVVSMTISKNALWKNDLAIIMDAAPMIINNRTFIPARFAAEAFDNSVSWDGENRIVSITSLPKPQIQYFKKYQNNAISFLYPSDWFLDESVPDMVFIDNQSIISNNEEMAIISVSHMGYINSSFSGTVSAHYDYLISDYDINISEFKNISIQGNSAVLFKYCDAEGDFITSYLIDAKNSVHFLEFITKDENGFSDIFNKIASSITIL